MWWDGLTAVDQNLQTNINRLVVTAEVIKLTEVNAWADASRHNDGIIDEMVEARGRHALETGAVGGWGVPSLAVVLAASPRRWAAQRGEVTTLC